MQLFAFLPLIIVGIVILTAVKSAEQKKQQEAKRRAFEAQQQQNRPVNQPLQTPPRPTVRPTVQVPNPARQTPANGPYGVPVRTPASNAPTPQKMHPQHENCAVRADAPAKTVARQPHPDHDLCALTPDPQQAAAATANAGEPILSFAPNRVLQGILYAEVFGKPKALR